MLKNPGTNKSIFIHSDSRLHLTRTNMRNATEPSICYTLRIRNVSRLERFSIDCLRSVIGLKTSPNFSTNQMQNQLQHGRTRFPALGADHVYLLSSHWFIVLFTFVVIGQLSLLWFWFHDTALLTYLGRKSLHNNYINRI